jgi:hypothetical protein
MRVIVSSAKFPENTDDKTTDVITTLLLDSNSDKIISLPPQTATFCGVW